jgi:hypothetical protein
MIADDFGRIFVDGEIILTVDMGTSSFQTYYSGQKIFIKVE